MGMSEFEESWEDREKIKGAIVTEPISSLRPATPVCVRSNASVHAAVAVMNEKRCGCVCVTDDDRLVGIFTERDVLRKVVEQGIDTHRTPVSEVMTRNPETLTPDDKIAYALNKMHVGGYRHIPLVQGKQLVGIISIKDIAEFVVELFPEGVLNVPPEPSRENADSTDGG